MCTISYKLAPSAMMLMGSVGVPCSFVSQNVSVQVTRRHGRSLPTHHCMRLSVKPVNDARTKMAIEDRRSSDQSIQSQLQDVNVRNAIETDTDINASSSSSGPPHRSPDENHRHSLPTSTQLNSLWQDSNLRPPSDDQVSGNSAAHRATALRQLTGTPLRGRLRHRSIVSTGTRTSLSSQPVLVRTYSGSRSRQSSRAPSHTDLSDGAMGKDAKFVPADSFAFDGILRAIEPDVKDTIDAIAQIYARTNLSLADEYDAHMPPQGEITGSNRIRHSGAPQRQIGNENALSAVPEASSSSERLSDQAGGSKRSSPSSVRSGQGRKSAYGALMDVMSGSPPGDTISRHPGKKAIKHDKISGTKMQASALLPNVRISQPRFAIHSRPGTFSGASSIHSRRSSLGLTMGRSISDSHAASAQATLDLSSTAIEGSSSRPSSQYEVHIGTSNGASGMWLPWLKSPKGESSQNAEHVLKSLLHRTQSDSAQHAGGLG